MITFKSFLLNEQQEMTFTFEEGLKAIKENCSWFLNESRGEPMFRGIGKIRVDVNKVQRVNTDTISWTPQPFDRKPKDSSREFNFVFNSMLDAAYEIRDIRKRSFFATGDKSFAQAFGQVMFCFPKGKSKWAWSPHIIDSVEQQADIYETLVKNCSLKKADEEQLAIIFDKLNALYKSEPTNWVHDLTGDASEITEQVVKKTRLKGIFPSKDSDPYQVLRQGLKETGLELYLNCKRLPDAISSGNEIAFYESDGYYLIPETLVLEEIKKEEEKNSNFKNRNFSLISQIYDYILFKLK
jgi:hypothetical protein